MGEAETGSDKKKRTNHEFTTNNIFAYNRAKKRLFIYLSVFFIALFVALIIWYYSSLRYSDIAFMRYFNSFISYVSKNIGSGSLLGAFYTTLFGGLFFIPIPLEIVFVTFLRTGNSFFFVIPVFIAGLLISFGVNYWIGGRLTYLSKRVVGIKRFYNVKSYVNRYGGWAIFAFNVLPLPAQILSVVAGVFKYNKTKFYLFFVLGQAIKYSIIAIGYFYIV